MDRRFRRRRPENPVAPFSPLGTVAPREFEDPRPVTEDDISRSAFLCHARVVLPSLKLYHYYQLLRLMSGPYTLPVVSGKLTFRPDSLPKTSAHVWLQAFLRYLSCHLACQLSVCLCYDKMFF